VVSRSGSVAPAKTGIAICATRPAASRDDALCAGNPDLFVWLGDTEFASAAAAWDALPEPLRQRLEGRRACSISPAASAPFPANRRSTAIRRSRIRSFGRIRIPRANPVCHARRLHRIDGIESEEAEALIAALASIL